jgi:hypothetical protein
LHAVERRRRHAPGIKQVEGFIRDAEVADHTAFDVVAEKVFSADLHEEFVHQPRPAAMQLAHASAEHEVVADLGRGCAPKVTKSGVYVT